MSDGGRGNKRKDRGATLIEAALVFPILILITVGIIEIGLAFKDYLTASAISREATRIGALAGADAEADCAVLSGIGDLISAGNLQNLTRIEIFRADQNTGNQIAGDTNVAVYKPGEDPKLCNVPAQVTDGWSITAVGWDPATRKTTVGTTPLDIIGVRVVMNHDWITGFPPFRGSMTIDQSTITRMEPEAFD